MDLPVRQNVDLQNLAHRSASVPAMSSSPPSYQSVAGDVHHPPQRGASVASVRDRSGVEHARLPPAVAMAPEDLNASQPSSPVSRAPTLPPVMEDDREGRNLLDLC
jgi:hypothetical protein